MGKMLVIADMKDSCIATPRGLQLAHKLGHAVEVVAFIHTSLSGINKSRAEQKSIKKRLMLKREKEVRARIDKYRAPRQEVSLKVVWEKDIQHWVIKRSGQSFDMVVKTGSHEDSIIYASTDWQLLRECPAPVLIVAEKKWHRTKPVLAAVDLGSSDADIKQLNHQIITTAKILAEALDTQLSLICAIEIPTLLADMDLIDPTAYVREAREKMKPAIVKLAQAYGLPHRSFLVKKGPVEKVITSVAAKQRAQLVVMGTVGRRGVRARLLGNTAEKVLRHLRTDVLTLKLEE
ncbi:MAG: universal stress protein E [Cryomorphaceae bacterium]|jgi:universal stress protein E